jgi:hypothetical protein
MTPSNPSPASSNEPEAAEVSEERVRALIDLFSEGARLDSKADTRACLEQFLSLRLTAKALYMAARWKSDRLSDDEEIALWTALRDALGLEPGTSTRALDGGLRCRPVAEVETRPDHVLASYLEHSIIDAKGGPCWISTHVAQSLREIALRTRPVSVDKLELHSLDYAIRVLEMEGVYDVTVTRLTDLRERLREGAK